HIPEADLAKVTAKTLVIAGTQDMIKEEHTRLIHAGIPDSELVFIEGDHFIAAQNPEAFNQAVLKFLA
ncbi:MAG: alpha/beta hydrolase, partial [Eubacterium sp.]|nr:alpha/beta hydrolase [Eubacterium sp.]